MIFNSNVLCCLRLLKLKTEGQTVQRENLREKLHSGLKLKFLLILGQLNPALNNPALSGKKHCENEVCRLGQNRVYTACA